MGAGRDAGSRSTRRIPRWIAAVLMSIPMGARAGPPLFADDAVMRHMTGVYAGTDAIRDFFLKIAFGNSARLQAVELLAQEDIAWLEVEAESDVTPGRQRVVDVFRLDEQGRITDVGVYSGNIVPGSDDQ